MGFLSGGREAVWSRLMPVLRCGTAVLVSGALLLPGAAGAAAPASTKESPAPQVSFAGSYNGSFGYSIDLKVPGFRGLEPNLQLDYSSSLVTSYSAEDVLGAGWRLQGLSSIVRANARRGAPTFDGTDIYLLDGRELVPCPDTTQAGCSAGGTHAVWQENYTRIKQDVEIKNWYVTAKDGTHYVYSPSGAYAPTSPTGDEENKLSQEYKYILSA